MGLHQKLFPKINVYFVNQNKKLQTIIKKLLAVSSFLILLFDSEVFCNSRSLFYQLLYKTQIF